MLPGIAFSSAGPNDGAAMQGAIEEKVIWEVFTGLLSRELLFEGLYIAPSEIARETYFFERNRPTTI